MSTGVKRFDHMNPEWRPLVLGVRVEQGIKGPLPSRFEVAMAGPGEAFRALRLLRVLLIIRVLRSTTQSARSIATYFNAGRSRAVIATVFSLIVVSIVMSSFLNLGVEAGHPDVNIRTAKDALLWSTTAMFGAEPSYFGDHRPVTLGGQLIAIWLVIVSLGLIASLAGVISAWIEDETPEKDGILMTKSGHRLQQCVGV